MDYHLPTKTTSPSPQRRINKLMQQLIPQTTLSKLQPQTILISGVTSGLGKFLSLELAKLGHRIIGCGRRQTQLNDLLSQLNTISSSSSFNVNHILLSCDVANTKSVEEFANIILMKHHIIPDVIFANAGIGVRPAPLWEVSLNDFEKIFRINVTGVFHLLKLFIPKMLIESHRPGASYKRILATSSGLGHSTSPVLGPYSATKMSVEALMKSIAQSLEKEKNIGAWPLAPGVIQTEMMRNEEMPTAAAWAIDAAPFIMSLGDSNTPSGASLIVPGYYSEEYMSTWIIENGQRLPKVVSPWD